VLQRLVFIKRYETKQALKVAELFSLHVWKLERNLLYMQITVYRKESFHSQESDTKISIYFPTR